MHYHLNQHLIIRRFSLRIFNAWDLSLTYSPQARYVVPQTGLPGQPPRSLDGSLPWSLHDRHVRVDGLEAAAMALTSAHAYGHNSEDGGIGKTTLPFPWFLPGSSQLRERLRRAHP